MNAEFRWFGTGPLSPDTLGIEGVVVHLGVRMDSRRACYIKVKNARDGFSRTNSFDLDFAGHRRGKCTISLMQKEQVIQWMEQSRRTIIRYWERPFSSMDCINMLRPWTPAVGENTQVTP